MSYQNVITHGMEKAGFAKSHVSWANIQQLGVSFYNRTVCDIGCFHGYFSFKAEEWGATVVGYEPDDKARETAEKIKNTNGSRVTFINKTFGPSGFFDTNFDIGVALNMLHWVREYVGLEQYKRAIKELCEHCTSLVLEVDPEDLEIITEIAEKQGKILARRLPSHRHGRVVAYFAPWGGTKTININEVKDYMGREIIVKPRDWAKDFLYLDNTVGRWGAIGAGAIEDMETIQKNFYLSDARNQPIHDLCIKYYMSPLKDTLRLIDAYNGIRAGVMLPPIGLRDDARLHQGHTRIQAYRLAGMDDIELPYYEREVYLSKSHWKGSLGWGFLL